MVKHVLGDDTGPTIRQMAQKLERRISSAQSLAKKHGLKLRKVSNARAERSWILSESSGNVLIDHGSIDNVERFLKDYRKPERP